MALSLYGALLIVTVSAGVKVINVALDRLFIATFILGWEQIAQNIQSKESQLPAMNSRKLVSAMNRIEQLAKKHSIDLPRTNTNHSYAHVLKKLNQPQQQIFLIIKQDHLIIYGLGQQTMQRIDTQIDGKAGLQTGRFVAQSGKTPGTYTGILTL